MTAVWSQIIDLADAISKTIESKSTTAELHNIEGFEWYNKLYSSPTFRRAHVEIVDFRSTHKIYILHSTIFPYYNDTSPIWGFDAVCGPNKITGAFHDFSSCGHPDHVMMNWFKDQSANFKWKKPRQLPSWAQAIFSPSMIAAGNISVGEELDDLCDIALSSLNYYLDNVGTLRSQLIDSRNNQNKYCHYQKQNPHVANSMISMGVPKELMDKFIQEVLFPESF